MSQSIERNSFHRAQNISEPSSGMSSWSILLLTSVILLLLLILGTYTFNWTWTGFRNNTLWDWLKLLVLPTVLTAVSIWFSTHMNELSDFKQGAKTFRQSAFTQGQANRYRQSPPAREVEYNDSTVLIRHPKPVQRIHQDIGDSAENLEKPVDNEPEI